METLHGPSTDLTYFALTGARKQSVSDVERLFSRKMESCMERKGYSAEAKYIRVIKNWRMVSDERAQVIQTGNNSTQISWSIFWMT